MIMEVDGPPARLPPPFKPNDLLVELRRGQILAIGVFVHDVAYTLDA